MKYYFDESGNWEEPCKEKRCFLMCGIAILNEKAFRTDTISKVMELQSNLNLKGYDFHATNLSLNVRAAVHELILEALQAEIIAAKILKIEAQDLQRTQTAPEDMYIEYASELLSQLALGDSQPEIISDMKFRGPYPAKVVPCALNPMYQTKDAMYDKLMESYVPKYTSVSKKMASLIDKLKKTLDSDRNVDINIDNTVKRLQNFDIELLRRYEFIELWINWTEKDQNREKYRNQILSKLGNLQRDCGMERNVPQLTIEFASKAKNVVGVQLVDFLCNLIYNVYTRTTGAPENEKTLAERICNRCTLVEGRTL